MSKIFAYISIVFFIGLLFSCSNSLNDKEDERTLGDIIQFSSSAENSAEVSTRAVSDFPNNGSIGVIAAKEYDPNRQDEIWTGYPDISNVEAVASAENNDVFSFTWSTVKYWPFDGSNLYFMAYSPFVGNELYYRIGTDNTSLFMALDPNLPDVMYASNNSAPQPYNKRSGVVQLGQFKHILSKLTVQVVADENLSNSIVVNNLNVSTNYRSASFFLYGNDDDLDVIPATERYVATLISGNVHFKDQPVSNTMLIFPGIHDDVEISITLLDQSNGISYTADFMFSFFVNDSNEPVELIRAENTLLTINVLNVGVENPERNIQLKGAITDWNFQGNFGIAIN